MFAGLKHLFFPHHSNNLRPKILHLPSLTILLALLAFIQASIGVIQSVRPDILGYASQIPAASIIDLTNRERAKANLSPLKENPQLNDAARRKAADMFAKDYWAHNSPTGVKPWYWITATGYNYLHAGENLARDFSNPNAIVSAWMDSPTHRDNLLSLRYQDIGVAVVDGYLDGSETTLVVQMFGMLQANAPSVSDQGQAVVRPAIAAEPAIAGERVPADQPIPTPTLTPIPYQELNIITAPLLNTFDVSRSISIAFALLLVIVLAIDWFVAWQQNLIRLSGKNWAHITYLLATIILGIIIKRGLIN